MVNRASSLEEALWRRIDKSGDCWVYTGKWLTRPRLGYGSVSWRGKQHLVHRLSWELANGPIPNGLKVLHKCDNTLCVRPEHLFLGTQAENIEDMRRKGRAVHLIGDDNSCTILSDFQVQCIREIVELTGNPRGLQKLLAGLLNTTSGRINNIVWRRSRPKLRKAA